MRRSLPVLLDTHAWVWWVSDPQYLSEGARQVIDGAAAEARLYVSSISVWEVAMLVARGRLELRMEVGEWVRRSEVLPFLRFVPVDNAIALRAVSLPEPFPADPADRIIVATALVLGATLVSKDERILQYRHVRALW